MERLRRDRIFVRALAIATGICAGTAAGFLITDGDPVILSAAGVCVAVAIGVSALVVPRAAWRDVLPLIALATVFRVLCAVALYDGLLAAGRGGFVTGDDAGYADLSSRLARILHGQAAPFDYTAESYLLGTFVYLETAIFWLFGPKVLIVELLNAAMGGLLVALVYDITRRLFADTRTSTVAATLVAFYPSLVLWSALNLKDSLALLLIAIVLWLIVLFQARRTWWLVPLCFAPLLLMETLRTYIFVGLALVIPASVILAPGNDRGNRLVTSGLSVALAGVLLIGQFTGVSPRLPSALLGLEAQRSAMGIGADTSFAEPPVVEVRSGITYVITDPASPGSPVLDPSPTRSPQIFVVEPGTKIVVAAASPTARVEGDVLVVRAGDVLVVNGRGATPAPTDERRPLELTPGAGTVGLVSDAESPLVRTIRHFPKALTYALFAPFPWSARRALDLLFVPEMLLWYLALVGMALSLVRYRRSWRSLAPLVLFTGGTLLILALAEGNVGTLFRHRAMIIPWVLILGSPSLVLALTSGALRRAKVAGATSWTPPERRPQRSG